MSIELREQDAPNTHQVPAAVEKPYIMTQDSDLQGDERMGLLDSADKTLSTTDVDAFYLPDILQVAALLHLFDVMHV